MQWRYLHEVCEPPIIHRNFKSVNLLLDEELAVHISDCGLAPLISSGAVSQVTYHPNWIRSMEQADIYLLGWGGHFLLAFPVKRKANSRFMMEVKMWTK